MSKTLTDEQVSTLYDFVKSKYVRYIDVQHELVDHLATDIETEMEIDEGLSFDNALSKVYAKFPITGFSKVVSKAEKAISKYWRRKIFNKVFSRSCLPYLSLLPIICYIIYMLILFGGVAALISIIVLELVITYTILNSYKQLLKGDKNGKDEEYLVVGMFKAYTIGFTGGGVYFFNVIIDPSSWNIEVQGFSYKLFFISFILAVQLVWNLIVYYQFPNLIRSVLKEKYGHLNLSI